MREDDRARWTKLVADFESAVLALTENRGILNVPTRAG